MYAMLFRVEETRALIVHTDYDTYVHTYYDTFVNFVFMLPNNAIFQLAPPVFAKLIYPNYIFTEHGQLILKP